MSSINEHYTFSYSQPEAYRFSHDSVFLARQVFERTRGRSFTRALDLCAGCGIVGLDYLFHRREAGLALPAQFDFLEVQDEYAPHFALNRAQLDEVPTRFLRQNYEDLTETYDLILCNPPYFRLAQGRLSPSDFKNRCRFFIDAEFGALFAAIERALSPMGTAYVLLRDQNAHGWQPPAEARKSLSDACDFSRIGDVRGTGLYAVQKRDSR
jgi:tRNA1Val (adenine37-N6)-methyltransferase